MRQFAFAMIPSFVGLALCACGASTPDAPAGTAGTAGTGSTGSSGTAGTTSSGPSGAAGTASTGGAGAGVGSSTSAGGGAGAMGTGGGASGAGAGGGAGAGADAGTQGLQATQVNGGYFPPSSFWYQDISAASVASDSTAITQWMESFAPPNGFGGSGMGQTRGYFTVDLSIVVVDVPGGSTKRAFQIVPAFNSSPDCDTAPVPVPAGGAVEGTSGNVSGFSGYACAGFDAGEDCHMLFVSRAEHRLYELYHATLVGNTFSAGCLALWDTSRVYDIHGRGDQCTSADAAGYPMAPLLFTAEEIQAGSINHAIRFALPNNMLRTKVYMPPATHGTNTTGPATSLPYGARMRLKTPYAGMSQLSPAAQVVARALQKYGMFHADGGNVPLMGQNDVLGKVKYADVGFDTHALLSLKATDFEVVAYTTLIPVTFDCMRTPITQ